MATYTGTAIGYEARSWIFSEDETVATITQQDDNALKYSSTKYIWNQSSYTNYEAVRVASLVTDSDNPLDASSSYTVEEIIARTASNPSSSTDVGYITLLYWDENAGLDDEYNLKGISIMTSAGLIVINQMK